MLTSEPDSFTIKETSPTSAVPPILNQPYFKGLDGLRALSIVFVLLAHFYFGSSGTDGTDIGAIGVEIFFVISGFLITTLLLKEKQKKGTIQLKRFYIRRFLRIVPVAILFLITLFLINIVEHLGITNLSFATAFLYLKNLPIKNAGEWYTGHFWSLSVEEQFYLVFPFLLTANQKITKRLTILLIILIPTISYLGFNKIGVFYSNKIIHNTTFVFINLLGKGSASIFVGCILSILLFEGIIKALPSTKYLSLVIFLLALVCRFKISPVYIPYFSSIVFSALIGVVIILNLQDPDNYFAKILDYKIFVKVGVLSYSLYIWQQIFTHQQPWQYAFKYSNSVILNTVTLFAVAYFSYNFYEKRFLTLKDKFK